MSLTQEGKDYIAQKFGTGNCYVSAGISVVFFDTGTGSETFVYGTWQIVSLLTMTGMYSKASVGGVDYTYAELKAANGGLDVVAADIMWIADHDDTPAAGETQYCTGVVPPVTCTHTCVVTDSVGARLQGALVKVNRSGEVERTCTTDSLGECQISGLTPDVQYNITVSKDGYTTGEFVSKLCISNVPFAIAQAQPPTGKATLWIATDPGCAQAWIDKDPATNPPDLTCTKDATKGEVDKIEISAPAMHFVHIRKEGFKDFYDDHLDKPLVEGDHWYVPLESLEPLAGTDVALLTVFAYKSEDAPDKVAIDNAALKKGTMVVGFVPYEDYWPAKPEGTEYNLSVVAEDRETYEQRIILKKDIPMTIEAFMPVSKVEVKIRIAEGVAYIGDISGGNYQTWFIGTKVDGWVRVETLIPEPTMFRCVLTFCYLNTFNPVSGIPVIETESKMLNPSMDATQRHLNWYDWVVPDKPGEYSLVAELFYERD